LANYTRKGSQKRAPRILVVDDDPSLLRLLSIRLRSENYEVLPVANGVEALAQLDQFRPDLVVTDLRMDRMDGITLLEEIQVRRPGLKVILLTAHGTIPDAVRATQSGAFSFLTKPVEKQQLLDQVQKALRVSGFASVDEAWRAGIVTRSPLIEQRLGQAQMAAASDARVLITGEAGTGKKAFAQAIHAASSRQEGPFVIVTCGEFADGDVDRDLFGSLESGGRGLLEAAAGGTLVLDEVADLPLTVQARLARALTDRRLPSETGTGVHLDARVIATTRSDLQQLSEQGLFREDLLYCLNTLQIEVPILARHREDIPLLVAYFLESHQEAAGRRLSYAPEAVEFLATVDWPGNVRQLENVVRQNVALTPSPVISREIAESAVGASTHTLPSYDDARDEFTRNYLVQLLQITGGNVSQAARLAKRNRTDFYKLLNRHQLSPDDFKART
jgi:two-component system response regulator GlrR